MQRQGALKRQKERARQEKAREKETNRAERRKDKPVRSDGVPGEDPDIAGIVPGPQPVPDEDVDPTV
ncbi:MAG: hypothetical protein HY898_09430 [Deltaproteobacteria bacterium]|nr:hypothetical protein [Deltaproteobacteria bacterium]